MTDNENKDLQLMNTCDKNSLAEDVLSPPDNVPQWFHPNHGFTASFGTDNKVLCLKNCASIITICNVGSHWFIQYHNDLSIPGDQSSLVHGRIWVDGREIRSAFGLSEEQEVSHAGHYVRSENFLNIPCKGTGEMYDPNISLLLTEDIKDAVKMLLDLHH